MSWIHQFDNFKIIIIISTTLILHNLTVSTQLNLHEKLGYLYRFAHVHNKPIFTQCYIRTIHSNQYAFPPSVTTCETVLEWSGMVLACC